MFAALGFESKDSSSVGSLGQGIREETSLHRELAGPGWQWRVTMGSMTVGQAPSARSGLASLPELEHVTSQPCISFLPCSVGQ